jgi:hypothetical protein
VEDNSAFVMLIAFGGICGFLGAIVGSRVRRSGTGFLLGFFFGPLGVIVAFALREPADKANPTAANGPQTDESDSRQISFSCEHCGHEMFAPVDLAGTEDRCGKCRSVLTIPLPRRKRTPILVECPDCGREVSRRAEACPGCGCPMGGISN